MSIFKAKPRADLRNDHILSDDDSFMAVEAFRHIRTNLTFCIPKKDDGTANRFVMTSASAAEGKSTVTTNLAITYANSGSKVLLIDSDLRLPRISKFFGEKTKIGLSNYLCGRAKLDEIVFKSQYENLSIIFSGFIPPNPNELFSYDTFGEMLDILSKDYDYIFIDTPPLEAVSDCLLIAPKTDGVIIVTRYKSTLHPQLSHALQQLEFAKIKVLGLVMNDYDAKEIMKSKNYKNNYYYRASRDVDSQ